MNAPGSKYPITYLSASKGEVRIEDMATPHIANSWRKLGGTRPEDPHLVVRLAMWSELVARGCTYSNESGQWTFPARAEAQ